MALPRKMADSSTLTFFFTVVVAFVVIRWFVFSENVEADPDQGGNNANNNQANNDNTNENSTAASSPSGTSSSRRNLRPVTLNRRTVTPDMIEVVKAMAPNLTDEQIEFDLQRTGNIELTVERYLANGSLPFPPNYNMRSNAARPSASSSAANSSEHVIGSSASSSSANISTEKSKNSLIDRYNLSDKLESFEIPTLSSDETSENPFKTEKIEWSGNSQTRQNNLKKQREMMILKARKNLEKKLKEEKGKN